MLKVRKSLVTEQRANEFYVTFLKRLVAILAEWPFPNSLYQPTKHFAETACSCLSTYVSNRDTSHTEMFVDTAQVQLVGIQPP